MPNPSTAINVHSFTRITPAAQLPDGSDPVAIMRRELKLLRIELERLRAMQSEPVTARSGAPERFNGANALGVPRYFFDRVP